MDRMTSRCPRAHRITRRRVAAAALALGAVAPSAFAVTSGAAPASHAAGKLVISSVRSATYGTILVSGTTVYTLKSNGVACAATCLKYWPEVLLPAGVTRATAGSGVAAAKLGTVKRGARLQVTYAGKALYWFSKDKAPGQVNGNVKDTWGQWSVVVVKALTSGSGPSTTTVAHGTTTTVAGGGGGIGF
jgi:predicted lipoprotein with Yx(FWY)xxD motif